MLTFPDNDNEDDITDKDIISYLGSLIDINFIDELNKGLSVQEIKRILQQVTKSHTNVLHYKSLSLSVTDKTLTTPINRKGIFQNTFIFTFHSKDYCNDAIGGFTESIEQNEGKWIVDLSGKRYFQKYQGSKTVLSLDNKQYGHRDDYTQFVLSNLTSQQGPIILDHTITFKSVEEESMIHDRFLTYPGIIPDLCTYATIKYNELYHNHTTPPQIKEALREKIENIRSCCSL